MQFNQTRIFRVHVRTQPIRAGFNASLRGVLTSYCWHLDYDTKSTELVGNIQIDSRIFVLQNVECLMLN